MTVMVALFLYSKKYRPMMPHTKQSIVMGALASVRPRVGFLSTKFGNFSTKMKISVSETMMMINIHVAQV